jgi:hypothetical protein
MAEGKEAIKIKNTFCMTKSLRKKHLLIWSALAVLLPVGIIAAYSSVEKPATAETLQPVKETALPVVLHQKENEAWSISIRRNANNSQLQLYWNNNKTLTVPTAVIYQTAKGQKDIANAKYIGRIEARGDYMFAVDSSFTGSNYQLLLYDFIHKQIIDSIQF